MKEKICGFVLSSVTYAMRAKEILAAENIRSYCEKLSPEITGCGCGYGLRVKSDLRTAENRLLRAGIRIKGYYEPNDIPR